MHVGYYSPLEVSIAGSEEACPCCSGIAVWTCGLGALGGGRWWRRPWEPSAVPEDAPRIPETSLVAPETSFSRAVSPSLAFRLVTVFREPHGDGGAGVGGLDAGAGAQLVDQRQPHAEAGLSGRRASERPDAFVGNDDQELLY